ncbi:phospholipase DDHD1-like [Palaemon carinicauda]|uniref:phospholipase DDHD1-like n=1 Tax=Palaemon carinicauda TaxID=392227 RepID=UPI0035B5E2FC
MDYSRGAQRHPQYPNTLHQQLSQLSLNQSTHPRQQLATNDGSLHSTVYDQSQAALDSSYGKSFYNASSGLYSSSNQVQDPSSASVHQMQQQHMLQQTRQDQLSSQYMNAKNQTLLGSTQLSCSTRRQLSPSNLGNASLQTPHITPVPSQTSSPIRSSLGGAQLGSSLGGSQLSAPIGGSQLSASIVGSQVSASTLPGSQLNSSGSPRINESLFSGLQSATENQNNLGPRSSVLSQLDGAQLMSSLSASSQDRGVPPMPSHSPFEPRLSGAQFGSSWNSTGQNMGYQTMLKTDQQTQQVGQVGNVGYGSSNQYGSNVMNGQLLLESQVQNNMQYHDQMNYGMGYSSIQQQQFGNTSYDQLQPFSQDQNFHFNVDYIDSSDPSAYQDYYYGDYQYNGSHNTSFDSLDPNYLGTPLGRAPTPYGDETVEDLGPEMVRWFYKIEADKKWTPFIGYDSLRIEWKYRNLLQDASISPEGSKKESFASGSEHSSPKEPENVGVERIVVRGGLYEADVKHRKCESLYWQGEVFVISRGTWFYEGAWGPVEESLADRIEYEHLLNFRGHHLLNQRIDDATKEVVHSMTTSEGQVDWFSASEVYLSSDGTSSRLMRSVGKKLGFQKTGYKLHRGYSIDANASDKPPDINHIVFVIHGIGQKMERGRIIKNCTVLRENIGFLKQKYYPGVAKSGQTVEFFPVEWRSSLVLDAGVIESITPHKIINIRQMLNASFMDIMYYNSPLYREEVIKGLTGEMNRLYTMFTQRNPYFEANGGKVSIVAHSLGCVITYDIVIGWNPAQQFDQQMVQSLIECIDKKEDTTPRSKQAQKEELKDLLKSYKCCHSQPSLNFKIENFFCLGSPLAVFLALRNKNADGEFPDLIPPRLCKRLLNIYHPADPVAYRIEPLLCSAYINIAPLLVHSYNSTEKVPYSEMPLEPIFIPREKDGERGKPDSESNTPVSSVPSTPVKGASNTTWSWWGLMKGSKRPDAGFAAQDPSSALQDKGGLAERTDFVLREGSMESSYISAVTSHTAYWTNYDVSHFILSILYPDVMPTSGKPDILKS